MKDTTRLVAGAAGWTVLITALHLQLNLDWTSVFNDWLPKEQRKFNVAYIPVT